MFLERKTGHPLTLAQTKGPSHEQYFYSFTDIKSRYSAIYFSNTKDEVLRHFELYKAFIETQTGHELKKFRSDNGGEYVNKNFEDFCGKHGISMETTAPYSPAQNGIAEQLNQTLLKQTRAGNDIHQELAQKPLARGCCLCLLYQESITDAGTWK